MGNIGIKTTEKGTSVCTKTSLFSASGGIQREVQCVAIERPKQIIKDFNNPYRVVETPPPNELLGLTALTSDSPLLIDVSKHSLLTVSSYIVGTDKILLSGIGYIPEDSTKANWLPVAYLPLDIQRTSYFTNKDTLAAMFTAGSVTLTDNASVVWNMGPSVFTLDVSYLDKVAIFIKDRLSENCTKVKICYALS